MKLLSKLAVLLILLCGVAAGSSAQGIAVNDQVLLSFSGNLKTVPGAVITVCTFGATGLPCNAPLTVYSNIALSTPIGTSVIADANGNFSYFIAPGTYTETQTAAGVTGRSITRTLACVSGSTCTVASGLNLTNPTPATNVLNQSSPQLGLCGSSWNGSASVANCWTFQNVPIAGTNAGQNLVIRPSLALGAIDMSLVSVSTGQLNTGPIFAGSNIQLASAPATGGGNVSSYLFQINGSGWNGSAPVTDTWSFQDILGTGNNPTATLTLVHSGGSGAPLFDDGGLSTHAKVEYCGATSGATQNCTKTVQSATFMVYGDVALNTATSQSITTLPFTTNTYSCSGSDLTTATGIVSFNTYAIGSVTIQESSGVNTDHLRYQCIGQ